jgi:hypothetical protein
MKALAPTIERGEISVVGAIYHLDTAASRSSVPKVDSSSRPNGRRI